MNHHRTFNSLIQEIRPFLSSGLCTSEYWNKIGQVASQFPLLSQGMFELRLSDHDHQIDFGVLIVRDWGEMDLLLEFHKCEDNWLKEPQERWKRILEICRKTISENGLLARAIQNIWVAFDLDSQQAITPYAYFVTRPQRYIPEITAAISKQILCQYGIRITDAQYSIAKALLEALPSSASLEAFGFIENRHTDVFRLALRPFHEIDAIADYLKEINGYAAFSNQSNLVTAMIKESESCQMLLDIADGLIPRIGLEFWINRDCNLVKSTKMLNLLIDHDFCNQQTGGQYLDWISYKEKNKSPTHSRWINHVKLTFEEGKPLQAKVYLSFSTKVQDRKY